MKRLLFSINILLLLFVNILPGQEFKLQNHFPSADSSNKKSKHNNFAYIEGGINFSDFQNQNSNSRQGYFFGFTFNYGFTNSIGLSLSTLVERENTYLNKRESTYNKNDICYRKYYDLDMSFLFLEFPASLYYKFWENESSAIYFSVGYGYSLAIYDDSKRTNFILSDEIVSQYACEYRPGDYYDNEEPIENSGQSFNSGMLVTYKKVVFKILYVNKRYPIKIFGKLHTLSVHLGYQLN